MIVADASLIAYFWIEQPRSAAARRVRRRDAAWVVPPLWRFEFLGLLRRHMGSGLMSHEEALGFAARAEADLDGAAHEVLTPDVLKLVDETRHSAYDCTYVALARALRLPLVTGDRALAKQFPRTAVVMEDFAGST